MKKDRSTGMDDKYWEGISSLREERTLKGRADKPYYKGLDQLSNEEMKWDFEDFMQAAQQVDATTGKRGGKRIKLRVWLYAAASIAVLACGFLFLKSDENRTGTVDDRQLSAVTTVLPNAVDSVDDTANGDGGERVHVAETPQEKAFRKVAAAQGAENSTKPEVVVPNEESYVIVNGKPVYDEAEAQEIVLASLKIMVVNFQEGKNALEKVKYINVEL